MRHAVFALSIVALSGCVSVPAPLPNPALVHGIVTQPHYVRWTRNLCGSNELVRAGERWITDKCFPHGGEIDSAILESPKDANGKSLGRSLRFGFPSHGFVKTYRKSHYLVLQRSPPDFLADTGIAYVATTYDTYDAANKCFADSGYAHLDRRQCSDKNFHIQDARRCVPEAEYLAHLAAGL